jgi:GNAT superfamily N-acetyltransferase
MSAGIRAVEPDEGERLREIAIAAKASWGYDLTRVTEWAAMADFSPRGLARKDVYVASFDEKLVGWMAVIHQGHVLWLDDLWIDPDWMGQGIGSELFRYAMDVGRQLGAARMEWEAEPNALGFYEKMGGRYVRDGDQSIWGRVNSVVGLDLA